MSFVSNIIGSIQFSHLSSFSKIHSKLVEVNKFFKNIKKFPLLKTNETFKVKSNGKIKKLSESITTNQIINNWLSH